MKEIRLKELEKSFEDKVISKKEYEKKKKEIEEMPEDKKDVGEEEPKEVKFKSDKALIVIIIALIIIFGGFFSLGHLFKEEPKTIDELHALNLKGKLNPEQGYLYNDAYSFVKYDELWYTQLMSPGGSRFYNIQFRYGPKDVESMNIGGWLNTELFDNATEYYVTFDPTGNDFPHVAVAVGDFNQHMTNIFFKNPIAACDKNETRACKDRPVITCDNTDKLVLYVKEANYTGVYYNDNCIVIEGSGFDLVKGIDRVLYDLYGLME